MFVLDGCLIYLFICVKIHITGLYLNYYHHCKIIKKVLIIFAMLILLLLHLPFVTVILFFQHITTQTNLNFVNQLNIQNFRLTAHS